jgi:hypothetical protein
LLWHGFALLHQPNANTRALKDLGRFLTRETRIVEHFKEKKRNRKS